MKLLSCFNRLASPSTKIPKRPFKSPYFSFVFGLFKIEFLMVHLLTLLCLFSFFSSNFYTIQFSWIRTWVVGVESKHVGYWTPSLQPISLNSFKWANAYCKVCLGNARWAAEACSLCRWSTWRGLTWRPTRRPRPRRARLRPCQTSGRQPEGQVIVDIKQKGSLEDACQHKRFYLDLTCVDRE